MVLAMVALLAMAALVIDGGNGFVQQRATQNGADAAAEAGAVVLAGNLAGGGHTDQQVLAAVTNSATQNGITASAEYTNINGNALGIPVGSLGTGQPPAGAAGVRAFASRTFRTYFAGIVGLSQMNSGAQATAVTGPPAGCDIEAGCTLLPITFPINPAICDGSGNQIPVGTGPYVVIDPNTTTPSASNESILGICKTDSGSVGWLAIQPEDSSCGGGKSDLECDILTPDYPPLSFPIWLKTETGNTNSKPITDAVNTYDGKVVGIPIYDCWEDGVGQLHPGPACPATSGGQGTNTYYRIVGYYAFLLDQAYVNGSNKECTEAPGLPLINGNGGNGCLKGWFVKELNSGDVSGGGTSNKGSALAIQLVR